MLLAETAVGKEAESGARTSPNPAAIGVLANVHATVGAVALPVGVGPGQFPGADDGAVELEGNGVH